MNSHYQERNYQAGGTTSSGCGNFEVGPQDHRRRDFADSGEAALEVYRIEKQEQEEKEEESSEEGGLR